MRDEESYRPAEDETRSGGELISHELSHVVQQSGEVPQDDDGDDPGDQVPDVVESAAELGLGALIAPFTGGETVSIVGSVASMFEAGFDRLTHLGEHETPSEPAAEPDSAEPADESE